MSEQSAADSGARLPFAGTTSDGQAAEFRPIRKIKPPSTNFLTQSKEEPAPLKDPRLTAVPAAASPAANPTEQVPAAAAPAPASVELPPAAPENALMELSGPAPTGAVHDLLSGPAPTVRVVQVKPATPPPVTAGPPLAATSAPDDGSPSNGGGSPLRAAGGVSEAGPVKASSESEEARERRLEAKAQTSYTQERLQAELKELDGIVSGLDSLSFLRPRVKKSFDEGADAITLVSFYRLTARALLDEVQRAQQTAEQFRREFETMRSKGSRLELELATAQAQAPKPAAVADPGSAARIQSLEGDLAQVNEQREKLLVDFKNSRDRAQRDLELRIFKEKEKFFRSFLPVLDSFERAAQTMNDSAGTDSLLSGFKMISGQLAEALKQEGLDQVDSTGLFDPRYHEAVGFIETQEKPDDYIFDVLSRGYQIGERLIRPAMVRVARNPTGVVIPPPGENVDGEGPATQE